jgi:hypothetical protein
MLAPLKRGAAVRRAGSVALMPAAAFAVHQLRYWLAFGNRAGLELRQQGHSYLHSVVPWIVLLIAVAIGGFLCALGRAWGGRRSLPRYAVSFVGLWLVCAACLVAIYVSQEFLEGLFATGHPGGLAGIFGSGGWWSVPAALAVGLVLASGFHGARWVLREVAERRARRVAISVWSPLAALAPAVGRVARLAPVADGWSGRGPPLRGARSQ